MKKRLKNKLTTSLGAISLICGFAVAIFSYITNQNIDLFNSGMFIGAGIFLLFATDELLHQVTLEIFKKGKKKL